MGLSNRQELFVNYFLKYGNASESAKQAGYKNPDKQSYRLLRNESISQTINERSQQTKNELIASADEVLQVITYEMRNADNSRDRIRSAELLGKRYGSFIEKIEIVDNTANNPIMQTLEYMKMRNKEINKNEDKMMVLENVEEMKLYTKEAS